MEITTAKSKMIRRWPRKTVKVNGVAITVYSIRWLAFMCERSVKTLQKWQAINVLPAPIINLKDGVRWYTAAEVKGYSKLYRSAGVRRGKFAKINKGQSPLEMFGKWAHDFRKKLVVLIEKDTGQLPACLPNEDDILTSMLSTKTPDWSKLVDKLIRD